ncbi:PLP-dependent aminotransferase family protein [Streptococcus uberis]|nr:PLP-dependent aminotransferase family protein [Streptococcus uberis]MCK1221774.1 PLP-dependent aminotransferase family protein [Streptococcus uberis]
MGTNMKAIYQKIYQELSDAIASNHLKKGEKLPSIRFLSQKYQCSKDTVQRALLDLKYANKIYAIPKSGYYVLGSTNELAMPHLSIDDYNDLAYKDFQSCLNETLSQRDASLLNYYPNPQGLEELIHSLHNYFTLNAIYAKENDIIITSGTQQALYILSQMSFPNQKEVILIEKPTYGRMENILTTLGIPFVTINRHFQGFDLKELENHFANGNIKFFYTVSRYSSPLGLSYRKNEKEKIVFLAKKYNVYIIEDDFLGDFSSQGDLPLHYFDTNQRVIYLKSFSMSVFPSLRIGALVLPQNLQDPFLSHKSMIDLDTNLIMQRALSLYLSNGMFEKNLKLLKDFFYKQVTLLEEILQNTFPKDHYRFTPQYLILETSHNPSKIRNLKSTPYDSINIGNSFYLRMSLSLLTQKQLKEVIDEISK